ncbi:MAG TPA: hypothetical protein VHU87_12885 [Rhizomicrobium sp.]|nr:hypothetical protein [Rhizomicrobium sp.]
MLGAGVALADGDNTILAKTGGSYDARAADQDRCAEIVQRAPEADLPAPEHPLAYPVVTGGGVAGSFFALEMIKAAELAKARAAGEEYCMHNLGYVAVPLTPDEAASYNKASHEAWERNFLAGDLGGRIKALNIPAVPPLPAYRDEPMVYGGLKIDAATLALTAPTNDGLGTIVTAKASRARTAVLVTPIATADGAVRVAADAGTVFHQVDHRYQREPLLRAQTATWCGPVRQISNGVEAKDFFCFTARDDGYEVFRPSGQPWYAGPYTDGLMLPHYIEPIRLEERAADDLGPLDLTIDVVDVHLHWVDLAAYVTQDGKTSEVWAGRYNFNSRGETNVQLWNQRLTIARATEHGSHLKLAMTQDGNGLSWRDEDRDTIARP